MLAGGTALGQGATILASPVLTRLYSPTDFGILAVYVSIFAAFLGVASLRYHLAIAVASDDGTVVNLIVLSLSIVIALSVLFGFGLWLAGDALVDRTQTEALTDYLWLLPLSFIGAGTYQVLNAWAIRNNHFGQLAWTRFGQGLGQVVTQVGLGLLRVGPIGLLLGDVIGRSWGSLSLMRLAWREYRSHAQSVSFARMRQVASRYRRFPLISSPSALLASARNQIPTLLIAAIYGGQVVGWFALGQRLLTVTFFLVASSVGDVYLNESAKFVREDPAKLMPFFWRTLRRSALVLLPLLSALAIIAPWIFGPLFGSEWIEAGQYVRVLAVVSLSDFLLRSVGSTVSVTERQDLDLASGIFGIALTSGALIAGGMLGASPMASLILYAIAGTIANIISLTLAWYAIRQMINNEVGRETATVSEG